ncbi:thioredoxin family protein [Desulfoluna sp.]|uniref:thioredoxin family protein n=1 Tax=Desulfoluna sp. TaxID=2045199 RepID=UPI00261255F0|nr:thioredoxin family protein [Desulfoluna sp.]
MKRLIFCLTTLLCLTTAPAFGGSAILPEVPTKNMVTMLDLGAHTCIPCKMMAPIITDLQKEYQGKASILFIDIKENRSQAQKYGIRAIPTQIFYDKTGKEVKRHVGFIDKKGIVAILKDLGVKKPGTK